MLININKVKVGMVLEDGVYVGNGSGYPLVKAGIALTQEQIDRLKNNNVKFLRIKFQKEVEETISDTLQTSIIKSLRAFNISETVENARVLVSKILESSVLSYSLSKYYENDNDLYKHSVNVATFATAVAKAYNDSRRNFSEHINLEAVAMAGLLHDIGKLCKDPDILSNIPNLDLKQDFFKGYDPEDYKVYNKKMYPLYSFSMLNEYYEIPTVVKMAIILTQENEMGTGPLKVDSNYMKSNSNQAVVISKIVNVADWYDFLIDKVTTAGVSPLNVTEIMNQLKFCNTISQEITDLLMQNIPLFSLNSIVCLSTGEYARVVEINKYDMSRPIVRILDSEEQINLSEVNNIIISKVADIETIYSLRENKLKDNNIQKR